MEAHQKQRQAVCGKAVLDLLNCIAETPYDQQKCVTLLEALHQCVIDKKVKKFLLSEQSPEQAVSDGKKQSLTHS